jgi:excisionase family DNA binding protein
MSEPLLSRQEVAHLLGVPTKTLAEWAYQGRGPAYYRIGKRVGYRESELRTWLEAQRVEPEGGRR